MGGRGPYKTVLSILASILRSPYLWKPPYSIMRAWKRIWKLARYVLLGIGGGLLLVTHRCLPAMWNNDACLMWLKVSVPLVTKWCSLWFLLFVYWVSKRCVCMLIVCGWLSEHCRHQRVPKEFDAACALFQRQLGSQMCLIPPRDLAWTLDP